MALKVVITNQKGGVAKTTTCINLSAGLAKFGRKVLLVDLDPQGNATSGAGVDKLALDKSIYHCLKSSPVETEAMIVDSKKGGFSILPSNSETTAAEVEMQKDLKNSPGRLSKALKSVDKNYEIVLIDCPPSLNMLTINGLAAADEVLIPVQCEYFALEGLSDLLKTIEGVKERVNPVLTIGGIIRTMFDVRTRLSANVSEELIKFFGEKVYNVIIPRNVALAEAPSHGVPVLDYKNRSSGAETYLALAGEFIRRHS